MMNAYKDANKDKWMDGHPLLLLHIIPGPSAEENNNKGL